MIPRASRRPVFFRRLENNRRPCGVSDNYHMDRGRRPQLHPRQQGLLRASCFDSETVAKNAIGAGVLPVARRASDGHVVLLLAKEHFVSSWRGSNKWSAFEGGRHASESIQATALREWLEESMGILYAIDERVLREREYVCKLTLNVVQNRRVAASPSLQPTRPWPADAPPSAPPSRYHVMYCVEVPYDEGCASRFRARRHALLELRAAGGKLRSASDAARGKGGGSAGDAGVHAEDGAEEDAKADAGDAPRLPSEAEQAFRTAQQAAEAVLTRVLAEARGGGGGGEGEGEGEEEARDHPLPSRSPSSSPLPGVDVERDASTGELLRLTVHGDYLEKEEVRWWSLHELQHVMHNGGRYQDEGFRAYFMPVLRGFLEFFTSGDRG